MTLSLQNSNKNLISELQITGSKSESNRLLILQALYPDIQIENLSNSDDTTVLKNALEKGSGVIDIHHAGTAMRFLTAYFASKEGCDVEITGSKRMTERPIRLLVDALQRMGANIEYKNEVGYPPLLIKGKKLHVDSVKLHANVSSQYVSALMLIGASLPKGLEIILEGQITSTPYILMTLEIMQHAGIKGTFKDDRIYIEPAKSIAPATIAVESDWSSASYFYSIAAITDTAEIKLSNYRKTSRQGDSCLAEIYKHFGVETEFQENSIVLKKQEGTRSSRICEDLRNSPDIAQTIAVTCLALGLECKLEGLHTLKIKETDRLQALKNEMEKFSAKVEITNDHLHLLPCKSLNENVEVETYNDHRMAMAFAPLAQKVPLSIKDADVVSKSYPDFWKDLKKLDFLVR
ncbi:3-phosphoshikimate 1-carboxyvinyltransferase [Christiangramia forsetii]|uniref:3-phosphoshikimate 1-carboxyvinyltransferase n=2 Tax=Christiangramia forsetii TaxID=411153 RepID=A0LY92_CHRFK|nr:3-phosphoshikimate 1-carboxyvinyltransferase [Christiangramia forsetii]GGG34779.1 3-phosphoshikimate 1-carboxyvinyltransferase [Christiangramia forsetii]CAL65337.1 3-phosphoshikimate 1-carboxyvinyltransferase [Christiangramia forsetii KT0803]